MSGSVPSGIWHGLSRFPNARITRSILLRSTLIWLGMRMGVAVLVGIDIGQGGMLLMVVLATVLAWQDSRRLNEHVFYANLGLSNWVLALVAAVPPVLYETVIGILV